MADTTKPRIDSWDATLKEAQRWQVYDRLRTAPWYRVAEWAVQEFGLGSAPSRSALYRFAGRMRSQESAHRIESALAARDEAGALVSAATADAATIAAYKALAQDLALNGRADEAVAYTRMALDIAAQATKAQEIQLKAAAQQTKDAQLKLAREKFEAAEARLGAVREAVEDEALSPDEVQKRIKSIFGLKN